MTAPSFDPPKHPDGVAPPQVRPRLKRQLLLPVGALAIVAAVGGLWYFLSRPVNQSLQLSGRIEGYETDVGAKTGGRVDQVTVREGDPVQQGQLLVRINDDDIQAQLRGATARVSAAQQQEQQARLQIDVVESQIRESQLNVMQSQQDNQGRIYQAEANVAATEAQLKQAQAQLKLARVNRDRYAQLAQEGAAKQIEADQAQTAYESAAATVEAIQRQVDATRGGLALAQTSGYNPYIRNAQLNALLQQRKRAVAQLQAAQADVKNAQAAQQQIQAQIAYLAVNSPINGVVTARNVEPGAVVASGKVLLTVIDLNSVYLRGFIPQGDSGRVRVGQEAKVFLDSNPKEPLAAKVIAIDPQASFTPENVYFKDDRVRQVVGVKLALTNPAGYAKPGMPADAEILVK